MNNLDFNSYMYVYITEGENATAPQDAISRSNAFSVWTWYHQWLIDDLDLLYVMTSNESAHCHWMACWDAVGMVICGLERFCDDGCFAF